MLIDARALNIIRYKGKYVIRNVLHRIIKYLIIKKRHMKLQMAFVTQTSGSIKPVRAYY